tara:strand:- start:202 stop:435 length:234 start_codon:yes stop_codon:yes gene_type:complete
MEFLTMKTTQLEKDIAFCIDELDLTNEQIGDLLRACENLGNISVEYFCEEFVFQSDTEEDHDRLHDPNYLTINWGLS